MQINANSTAPELFAGTRSPASVVALPTTLSFFISKPAVVGEDGDYSIDYLHLIFFQGEAPTGNLRLSRAASDQVEARNFR